MVRLTLEAEVTHQRAHAVVVHAELFGEGLEGALLHEVAAEDFVASVLGLVRGGVEALARRVGHDRDSPGGYFR